MCFLNDRRVSHHNPRNLVDSSTGRSVFPIRTVRGLWARERDAVKCTTLNLWAANLKPFLVAHSCMAFTACCKCLSMASIQGASTKTDGQVINKESSEDVPGYKRGLLVNLQAKTCHGQDTTNWDTFLGVEFFRECGPWDILTPKQAVCPWGQSCEGLGWSHIARLSHRPFPNQRKDQLPAVSVQRHPGDIFQDSQGGRQC